MDTTILASILILGFGILIALGHAAEYAHKYLKKTESSSKVIDTALTLRFNIWGVTLSVVAAALWRLFITDTVGRTFESLLLELLIIFGLTTLLVIDRFSLFVVNYHKEKGSPADIQKSARNFRYKICCIATASFIMLAYNAFVMKG